jgi:hypothetical protein
LSARIVNGAAAGAARRGSVLKQREILVNGPGACESQLSRGGAHPHPTPPRDACAKGLVLHRSAGARDQPYG